MNDTLPNLDSTLISAKTVQPASPHKPRTLLLYGSMRER